MSTNFSGVRHTRGFDVVKPLSITVMIAVMLPLVLLPLASIFIFGTSSGLASFWAALMALTSTASHWPRQAAWVIAHGARI